jgi:hypothetical protein
LVAWLERIDYDFADAYARGSSMKNDANRAKDWARSLGAGAAAVLIVGAVLYIMANQRTPIRQAVTASDAAGQNSTRTGDDLLKNRTGSPPSTKPLKTAKARSSSSVKSTKSRTKVGDLAQRPTKSAPSEKTEMTGDAVTTESITPVDVAGTLPPADSELADGAGAPNFNKPSTAVPLKRAPSPATAVSAVERKNREASWLKRLTSIHKGFHVKGSDSARLKASNGAEAEVDKINDPMAVQAIWNVLSGKAEHHQLVARTLARLDSPASTKRLAALSVYSPDEKARRAAANALVTRDPADFVGPLTSLLNFPLNSRVGEIEIPGQGRARVLLVEGERINYQFLYPVSAGPQSEMKGVYSLERPYMPRQVAEQFNKLQLEMAHAATEEQIKADQEVLRCLNERITLMSERALAVLRLATGRYEGPDREAWQRWLAQRNGYPYVPPKEIQKPTIAQIVPPAYSPTFVPVPIPS